MLYIDTHAHLSDESFKGDRDSVIEKSINCGVRYIFEILCSPDDWEKENLFSKFDKNFYFAYGIHPEYAGKFELSNIEILKRKISNSKTIFIGEIGLDYFWVNDNKNEQKSLLVSQLALSKEFSKPCVFHCRNSKDLSHNAYQDALDLLEKNWNYNAVKRGIMHSFSGSMDDAIRAIDLGLYLGINATITYPKNSSLREIVKKVGSENIVFETDCPYLPLQSRRGTRNTPESIPEIAAQTAAFCSFSQSKTIENVYNNSISFIK